MNRTYPGEANCAAHAVRDITGVPTCKSRDPMETLRFSSPDPRLRVAYRK